MGHYARNSRMHCMSFAHPSRTSNPLPYSEILPDVQITFHHKSSFLRRQKTQRIDTRHLFASFSADQTQGSSNTFSSFVNGDVETFEQIYRWPKMAFESYSAAKLPTPLSLLLSLPKPFPIQPRLTEPYLLPPRPFLTIVRGKFDCVITSAQLTL